MDPDAMSDLEATLTRVGAILTVEVLRCLEERSGSDGRRTEQERDDRDKSVTVGNVSIDSFYRFKRGRR